MTQRLREPLALALIALLPFHALLVTALTKIVAGPGHAPLGWLVVWKEEVLAVILLIACFEIIKAGLRRLRIDLFDGLILSLVALSVAVTAVTHGDWRLYSLGFKYDFVPLVAFFILRRVPWSEWFRGAAMRTIIIVGGIVAAYGILTFFLPLGFFTTLGYSPAHSLYDPGSSLAAFQQIGESAIRRIQSTFGGPNQFGVWLLLPLGMCSLILVRKTIPRFWYVVAGAAFALCVVALFLTFSRSAWIGGFAMTIAFLRMTCDRRLFVRFCGLIGTVVVAGGIAASLALPQVFFRLSSSRGHLVRPMLAIATMRAHPLGLGLGSAGPATNRVSEPCVFLHRQDDPSWARATPELCVFLGTDPEDQVQPPLSEHRCRCPFLPENWYLQIGVELGAFGLMLYLALTIALLRRLMISYPRSSIHSALALSFFGVSVAALFLHAWEDAATAMTAWVCVAVSLRELPQSAEDVAG